MKTDSDFLSSQATILEVAGWPLFPGQGGAN